MAHSSFSISRLPQPGVRRALARAERSARDMSSMPSSPGSFRIFSSIRTSSASPSSSSNK